MRPRERLRVETLCVEILTAARIRAGVKRPDDFPRTGNFVTLFLNGGDDLTAVTEAAYVEVESWAMTKSAAIDQLHGVTNALEGASFTRGLREITESRKPGSLETGYDGWFRYTAAFEIQYRTR